MIRCVLRKVGPVQLSSQRDFRALLLDQQTSMARFNDKLLRYLAILYRIYSVVFTLVPMIYVL